MRLRNRPLLATGLDDELYVPRPYLEDALHGALRDHRNVLLVGERGSGKTTLLRRMIADSPDREIELIDATAASTAHDLIRLIGRALGQPPTSESRTDDPVDLLDALAELPQREELVLVIDGSLDADVAYIFFGRLRDQLWPLSYTWIVSATPHESGAFRTPPADAFWSLVLEVPLMDSNEINHLLERGLDGEELARLEREARAERPIAATPRHVVRWAQDVLDSRPTIQDRELLLRAEDLGRQATMAFYELEALGRPAAAGDPELLHRLGWTRANTARWLARMEDAGILRSFTAPPQDRGRPPKLYEPVRSR